MAIRLAEEYLGKVEPPSEDYPHGAPRNESMPDANDGTPFEEAWLRDYEGFFQALLKEADITPSGEPDTALTSQRLEALKRLLLQRSDVGPDPEQIPTNALLGTAARANLGTGPDQVPTNDVLLDVFTSKAQYEYDLPLTAIADEPSPLGYKSEPQLIYCADGSILCVYRRGSAHVSNDGRIVAKRSTDWGRSWGAEILVHNQEPYDTRNPTVGIDPDSGRLIVFSRTADTPSTHVALYYQTSDDHGATWSPATDISALFADITADGFAPFGPIVKTSNGLMQLIYAIRASTNQQFCWALFSTDGGLTWGNRTTVYVVEQALATFTEPVPVRLDDDRLVVLVRDDQASEKYWYRRSADGGLTWDAFGSGEWRTQPTGYSVAAPIWGVTVGETDVVCAWAGRSDGVVYTTRLNKEVFWARPWYGWAASLELRRRVAISKILPSASSNWAEFGYPCLLEIPGVRHTALIAWYDAKENLNTTETDIWITTLPR